MTSRNSELNQAYDALLGATTALEICNLIIACQHYQEGEEGEPPQIHRLNDLAPHDPVQVAHDTAGEEWEELKRDLEESRSLPPNSEKQPKKITPRHVRNALGFEGARLRSTRTGRSRRPSKSRTRYNRQNHSGT